MQLDVSDIIGAFGPYHAIVLCVTVLRALPSAWTLTGLDFLSGDVDFVCAYNSAIIIPGHTMRHHVVGSCGRHPPVQAPNGTYIEDTTQWQPCPKFIFNSEPNGWSVVPEWDLVCERRWMSSAVQSIVFGGSFVGAILFGLFADWQGRRRSLMVSTVAFAAFAMLSAAFNSLWLFNTFRFGQAAAVAGIQITSASLFMELLLPRDRYLLNVGFTVSFAIFTILIPFVAYQLNSWRLFQFITGLCALGIIPPLFVVEESPRWLISQKRTLEAREVLNSIFMTNKRKLSEFTYVMSNLVERTHKTESEGILRLLSHGHLRAQLLLILLYWLVENGIYYAEIFLSAHIEYTDKVTAFTVGAAAEIPAGLVGMIFIRLLNRRSSMAGSLAVGSACAIVTAFIPIHDSTYSLVLSALTRFFLTLATSIKWVYTLELLPTNIRSLGFASAFAMGRIGGIFAPFIRDLAFRSADNQKWCFAIIGGGSLVATVLIFFLPETLNAQLPDSFFESYRRTRRRSQSLTAS